MGRTLLAPIFIVWAGTCAAVGAALLRRAPAVSLALFGSVLGAIGGFLVGNADGPAEVPNYTSVGASVGRRTGFCNYQQVDVLGGWIIGVIVAFLVDTWFVAGLFLLAAWQARRSAVGGRHGPKVATSGC